MRSLLLACVVSGCVALSLSAQVPHFLRLPFADANINIQQGWYYEDGSLHKPLGAIDYVNGGLDDSRSWTTFDVVAAADGMAVWDDDPVSDPSGYGNMVLIRHNQVDAQGRNYFTLYAHLQDGTIPSTIPKLGRRNTDYQLWRPVQSGEVLGKAGSTGWNKCVDRTKCVHLHFEVNIAAYYSGQTDAYGIQMKRAAYNPPVCVSFLWLSCPPVIGVYGTEITTAMLNGTSWRGPVSYNIVGPNGVIIGQQVPGTTSSLTPGFYTLFYLSGLPANSSLLYVIPTSGNPTQSSQILTSGGTIAFTLWFVSSATGTVNVNATLNGAPWEGEILFIDKGATGISSTYVPLSISSALIGQYEVPQYLSAGPENSRLVSITPSTPQFLGAGGSITYTFNFSSL